MRFERMCGLSQLVGPGADQSRDPVHAPKLIKNGTTYPGRAICLKFNADRRIELINGIHQSENAGTYQVIKFNLIG